jgi:hypothetical protein
MDSAGSGQGSVVGCGECSDEPSGSCATELDVKLTLREKLKVMCHLFLILTIKQL